MRTRAALLALALVSPLHATERPLSAYISGGVKTAASRSTLGVRR